MGFKNAEDVNTAAVVATGLIGGWNRGPLVTAGLSALYIGAFGASHPLAKKIGAWPSVLTVTALTSGAAHLLSDRK